MYMKHTRRYIVVIASNNNGYISACSFHMKYLLCGKCGLMQSLYIMDMYRWLGYVSNYSMHEL